MTIVTLHRLLWGHLSGGFELDSWTPRPHTVPAVGLPTRVASYLFCTARKVGPPPSWTPKKGPLTWEIRDVAGVLAQGRISQFTHLDSGATESTGQREASSAPHVKPIDRWELPPHSAYLLPQAMLREGGAVDPEPYALYCDVLLLLTALDGGERLLDALAQGGTGVIPFEERWLWRARIHLPGEAWAAIHDTMRWPYTRRMNVERTTDRLLDALFDEGTEHGLSPEDFAHERVDLKIDTEDTGEISRTIRRQGTPITPLPSDLRLDESGLDESLTVRIGQVSQWVRTEEVVARFPQMGQRATDEIMEQVAAAFQSPSQQDGGVDPALVVLPEVTIPETEVQTLRDLVAREGRAALAGLYWRVLPPVYKGPKGPSPLSRRWFVNEAELVVPMNFDDVGPTTIRSYRVRKPVPAHLEVGLAKHLSESPSSEDWEILPGRRWYRFVHRRWGDFTVAICSDLLDSAPWHSLRGEMLHLFMVGFNPDVDLSESLTWVRAYENYVNVVGVNHGAHGGSFLWTPKSRYQRQLAQLRGAGLFLLADVNLPVTKLREEQVEGVRRAEERAQESWRRWSDPKAEKKEPENDRFKSPPPGYRGRR